MTLLIVCTDDPAALAEGRDLAQRLQDAGMSILSTVACHMLVREVVRLAPVGVVVLAKRLDPPMSLALALLATSAPRPVLLVGAEGAPTDLLIDPAAGGQGLIDRHVMAWLPGPCDATALAAAWALALPRFEHEQRLAGALAGALARLEERKWVDRAKGVLMRHQQLSEDDAFTMLRTASMQANLRVGEVSRGVIEAAQAADAVNRCGQIRMLSQRLVKGLALRSIPRPRPDDHLVETAQRLQANLDHLATLNLAEPVAAQLASARAAWIALQATAATQTAERPARQSSGSAGPAAMNGHAVLQTAEAQAEALLAQADALTTALETASGSRYLRVINLCGRQRMLSQRLAKQALLAGLLPGEAATAHASAAMRTVQEFESALDTLERAPLASDAIRAALAQARGQWQRLLDGLRRSAGHDPAAGRAALARESEGLLTSFEQLTSLYEHSMQVLLG